MLQEMLMQKRHSVLLRLMHKMYSRSYTRKLTFGFLVKMTAEQGFLN